jgi:hypothetical protein
MGDEKLNSSQEPMKRKERNRKWWASIHDNPIPTVSILMSTITFLLTVVIGVAIFNAVDLVKSLQVEKEKTLRELEHFIEAEKSKFKQTTAQVTRAQYSDTIERYTRKLATGDSAQKAVAIWVLLDILNEIKRNHPDLFERIVCEYSGTIPYLKLDIAPEEFNESYRGAVWIWVILLESKNDCIRDAIRNEVKKKPKLTAELLDKVYERNASGLPEKTRKEFRESIDRLKPWIQSLRTKTQG